MKRLLFVVILLLVGIVGVGFYRGWFGLSTNNTDHTSSATITVNQDKIRQDETKAKEKVQDLEQKAKEKTGVGADKVKEPERQP